jgi:NodT family efflux transporter outer membrane factor (OMF) lipoprotein
LKIALARLQEARSLQFEAAGVALPEADIDGAVARGSGSDSVKGRIPSVLNSAINTSSQKEVTEVVGIDAAWNLDLFGGLRREIEAAQYDTQAAMEARNDVLTSLIASVALAYMDERASQLRLAIAQSDIQLEQHSADLVQARYVRGFTNDLDPALAQRELAEVQSEVAPLQAEIEQDQRRLSFLLGEFPGHLTEVLNRPGGMPLLPERIAPGLPIELLKRRPDVREAERELAAETARIGVKADALYPHVFISGALGVQGQGFGRSPLEASFIDSIGPGAYWSLLDFGTLDAMVEHQEYKMREALYSYQRTILAAVEETDDAIRNYAAEQDRLNSIANALTAAQNAMRIATQRYQGGFTNYLDVLDAQRELYALEDEYALSQEAVVDQFISIYKALGGGWENYTSIPAIRRPMPAIIADFRRTDSPDDKSLSGDKNANSQQ